jgi:hypothetical protein
VFQEVYQFSISTSAITIPKFIRAKTAGTWGDWYDVTVQRNVPKDAKLDYIKTLTSDAQAQINSKMPDGTVPISKGGTNATDVETARANLGFITGGYDGTNNARTIEVGGTSNVLIVWGGGYKTIVTPTGSIGYGGTQAEDGICNSGEVTFENGVLRIKKSFDATWESHRLGSINKNGTYYRYQAL